MRLGDLVRLSFKALKERKLRAALTILSVVVGVASVITLMSQSVGIQASIVESLETIGPTTIMVLPGPHYLLTDRDIARISELPDVSTVFPIITNRLILYIGGKAKSVTVLGIDPENLGEFLKGIRLYEGSFYPKTPSPIVLVGYKLAFPSAGERDVIVGQILNGLRVDGQKRYGVSLHVSGILDEYGASAFVSPDDSVFMPLEAAKKMFNVYAYNTIIVKTGDPAQVEKVADWIQTMYGENVRIITVRQIAETVSFILRQFGILLVTIASISLGVAGLGIMNIMLVSVIERTREIGLLKALGFKNRDVLLFFLMQAAVIGVLGGLIGLATGAGTSYIFPMLIERMFRPSAEGERSFGPPHGNFSLSYTPIITLDSVVTSMLIAVLVSLAAGLYPAWRASRMDPIKALRYE